VVGYIFFDRIHMQGQARLTNSVTELKDGVLDHVLLRSLRLFAAKRSADLTAHFAWESQIQTRARFHESIRAALESVSPVPPGRF
jgi:hypothetical protein